VASSPPTSRGAPGSAAHDEFAKDVALQSDGRIVAVGVAQLDVGADLAVARYLPDGTPDGSFGPGGRITVDFHGKFDAGNDVAVQPADGRIVVGGSAVNGFAVEAALVRFLP
jgi:uncharacterized delta-60 repeat protein